ncbi:WAS/WASL-interacting protein family member 2 isoform X1 [Euwallacea fornicatus]|uniref:WAS/WASL-interacting protein family member 2 isoform X1 n=1 Tax=Euwallacea fornicatus TaxID=995702 RepID=UPI00338D4DEB
MPGPPPPPPPGPPPPPALSLPKLGGGGGGADQRGALLSSIRQGTKLKKTVTVDKSGPVIPGKTNNISNNNAMSIGISNTSTSSNLQMPNGLGLGGLFAGGMPKLKATGRLGASTLSSSNTSLNNNGTDKSPSPKIGTPSKNFSSVQDQLKRQMHNPSDTRSRGPAPPAPMRHISVDETRSMKPLSLLPNNSNGVHLSQSSLHQDNISPLHNTSMLHRKSKSNANLSSLDCTDNVNNGGYPPSKPVINHGKPNLAPKPPILNGKPTPPTKLAVKPNKSISRAQSMRSPRPPSPQSPTPNNDPCIKFGTVRNMHSILGQSLSSLSQTNIGSSRPRPLLTSRPSVPPPSVPPPAAPLSSTPTSFNTPKSTVKPPNHAPPPPPGVLQAPPPPPPHKTQLSIQPSRPSPAVPTGNNIHPPMPPPRGSSMSQTNVSTRRTGVDMEDKFRALFNTPDRFPRPPPYRNVLKLYSTRQVTFAASNKQHAPPPPQVHLQPSNRAWNSTSTC